MTWSVSRSCDNRERKYEVPVCHMLDVELLLHVIREFHDVCDNNRLHISEGPVRFTKFRECLKGTPRDRWDTIVVATRGAAGGAGWRQH